MQHEIFLEKSKALTWIQQKNPIEKNNPSEKFRFIDLFSGCGGLSAGITRAAIEHNLDPVCVLAIDSNKEALEVFKSNIPHEPGSVISSDIIDFFDDRSTTRSILGNEVCGGVDVLVAGPPCQGHSDLNNSTRRNDPRNLLYLSCLKAVEVFSPRLVIIENVPAVVHSSENVVSRSELELRKLGYEVTHLNINFLDLGIPQSRKRHILLAAKINGFCGSLKISSKRNQHPALREYLEGATGNDPLMSRPGKLSRDNMARVEYLFEKNLYDLPNEQRPSCHRDKKHSYTSVYGRLKLDQPAQTLTSGYGSMGQGRYIHPVEKRTLNSYEAARIQGFPDYFSFSPVKNLTSLRKMIANAVPPQLSYVLTSLYLDARRVAAGVDCTQHRITG